MEKEDPQSLKTFFERLRQEVLSGLRHGFFDFSLRSEITNGNKRRLTFSAGKTHKFVIPDEDIPE